jgi:hypothetical protein
MSKQVLFSDEARAALLRGVNIMASAVKGTHLARAQARASRHRALRALPATARAVCFVRGSFRFRTLDCSMDGPARNVPSRR